MFTYWLCLQAIAQSLTEGWCMSEDHRVWKIKPEQPGYFFGPHNTNKNSICTISIHLPTPPPPPPQSWHSLQLLSYQFTCLGVFPSRFPSLLLPHCHEPQQPPLSDIVFSQVIGVVFSQKTLQSHLYSPIYILSHHTCLCWESPPNLLLQVMHNISQGFHECLSAPWCVFCFLAQFSVTVCTGFKQCLRALVPQRNQMSQDFVHPSNHCITTWLQLTPSQLATSGLVSGEHPMGTGHHFYPAAWTWGRLGLVPKGADTNLVWENTKSNIFFEFW